MYKLIYGRYQMFLVGMKHPADLWLVQNVPWQVQTDVWLVQNVSQVGMNWCKVKFKGPLQGLKLSRC